MHKRRAVLGLRLGPGHDTGAALVYEAGGELRCVAMAEERLSREKNSRAFPRLSIEACLGEIGIAPAALDAVVFEKTNWQYGAQWYDQIPGPGWAHLSDDEERAFFASVGDTPCFFANHHLLHAATAWHTTRWAMDGQPGALLVVDGRGSTWPAGTHNESGSLYGLKRDHADQPMRLYPRGFHAETQSLFIGRGRGIERVDVSLRSGIGVFYSWLTQGVLGFGQMHAGKSMGLAAYGDPTSGRFPEIPDAVFDGIHTDLGEYICTRFNAGLDMRQRGEEPPTDQYFADAAAWGQQQLVRSMTHLARYAIERTGARRLGLSGGVALNVVANRAIRDELMAQGRIDEFFVQPAASDAGLALGAALLGYYSITDGKLPFQANQVYLGPTRSADDATQALLDAGGELPGDLISRVADLLLGGKIVAWFQGRSEHGPRALGARSILCWPRPEWMKDHLNAEVKHREAFRPFAPIVQEEHAPEIFDADFPVPYMLVNTVVREGFRGKIPAVTHADGSGRLQTVDGGDTPLLYELLGEIRRRDGVGVLLNTSFNDNGEPIVETPAHAIRCFQSTKIDALVCGNALLVKPDA